MTGFVLRRVGASLVVLAVASVLVFLVLRLAPGDPATTLAGPDASPAQVVALRHQLGLDRPAPVQYWIWLTHLLTGDLGTSYLLHRPIGTLIVAHLDSTIELAVTGTLLMVLVGLVSGVLAATSRFGWVRSAVDAVATLTLAVPPFVSGVLLALLFGITWNLLPISGQSSVLAGPEIGLQYLAMPALALALPNGAVIGRVLATTLRAAAQEDYVRTAVAKGVPPRRIRWRHLVRNSLGPALVVLGVRVGELFGGAVVIEAIFARAGLGQLLLDGVNARDYLLVQDLILGAIAIATVVQLFTEVAYARLDPRVRLGAHP